ncbi:polysaccharide pyruvyl transferase family protein [Alloiococcus sp. CFN-8]|uniref:polysaccharide pyruvyl transferase family protein n=1 Tax=Alloiococcus sp. CFN-8 TaxID=3416081 RepID=UPI003CF92181
MKKVLYMHTGSGNHGCEAIVRSTSNLLGGPKEIKLWSLAKVEEVKYGIVDVVEDIIESEEIKKYSVPYYEALIRRRLFRDSDANMEVFIKQLFKDSIAFSIGGDNYCYKWSADQAIKLNKLIRKHCKKSVLWGCSIDPEAITSEMADDLSKFDLITARESITYNCLKAINPNTVQVADSAFLLEEVKQPLPDGLSRDNTVGINISPLIMKYGTDSNMILKNYEEMIGYILDNTDMNICLIPHVVWEHNNDLVPIRYLYEKFESSNRIGMIKDGNCMELKGYISQCRFFIGARTHATIAAYSSYIPTLVVGYSVKSRGIAQDLFGTYENYVLPVQALKSESDLKNQFIWLMKHEEEQKEKLRRTIPDYIELAKKARNLIEQFEI